MKTEIRARASIEIRSLTDEEKEAGYIGAITGEIPYNSESKVMEKRGRLRPFVERLGPDVFKRSINEDKDIMLMAGHTEDPQSSLARIGENLLIKNEARGMSYVGLLPDTKTAHDIYTLVEKKIIRGTSFEFEVRGSGGEKWEKRDDRTDLRTITDARLYTFNPVVWPAYEDASLTVEMRSREQMQIDREVRNRYLLRDPDGICDWCDPTLTPDTKYATSCMSLAEFALTDALEYLRAMPAGGMAELARTEVSAAAARLNSCVEWLSANGAQVNEALVKRAKEKLVEARSETAAPPPTYFPSLRLVL